MSASPEVPMNQSGATGKITITYDKCNKKSNYIITWKNLPVTPIRADIYGSASRDLNASVIYDFTASIPKTASGTFSNSVNADRVAIKKSG